MTSEIRTNSIKSRTGLSTVSYADTGIIVSGIVTATSFSGDGSNLTGITGTTINNNAANRVITGEGGTTLNGESNLTFDGSSSPAVLGLTGDLTVVGGWPKINLQATQASGENYQIAGAIQGVTNQGFCIRNTTDNANVIEIDQDSSRNLKVVSGNVVIGTAAKGIDFSAQTSTSVTGSSTSSELLDHYEEGTFTPVLASGTSLTVYRADFIRIGRLCHIELGVIIGSNSSGTVLRFERLPFDFNPGGDNAAGFTVAVTNTNRDDTFYGNRGNNWISCANKSNQDVSTSTYSNKQIRISGSYIIS